MKRIVSIISLIIILLSLTSCGEKKWEYKEVVINRNHSWHRTNRIQHGNLFSGNHKAINKMGEDGWEMVDVYTIMHETRSSDYPETYQIVYVFKREKK